jgi:hypothetical protein
MVPSAVAPSRTAKHLPLSFFVTFSLNSLASGVHLSAGLASVLGVHGFRTIFLPSVPMSPGLAVVAH